MQRSILDSSVERSLLNNGGDNPRALEPMLERLLECPLGRGLPTLLLATDCATRSMRPSKRLTRPLTEHVSDSGSPGDGGSSAGMPNSLDQTPGWGTHRLPGKLL